MDSQILRWLSRRRQTGHLDVSPVGVHHWTEWSLSDGAIRRLEGGFFTVRAFEILRDENDSSHLVLIDQPEIGILGFATRQLSNGRRDILVQGKGEPGNVLGIQIGPTVQATRSNYMQVHGGRATPYLDSFLGAAPETVSVDVEQSEQGTIFLGKFNRNILLRNEHLNVEGPQYAWIPIHEVLSALLVDFAVNTDARSVLVCADWRDLSAASEPFERPVPRSPFGAELRASYLHEPPAGWLEELQVDLDKGNGDFAAILKDEALESLRFWQRDKYGFYNTRSGSYVRMFSIHAPGREVERWQQPLVGMPRSGRVALVCRKSSGVLQFLFRRASEPGFQGRTELSPMLEICGVAQDDLSRWGLEAGLPILSVNQSEEGGRFFRVVNRYEIRQIDEYEDVPHLGGVWLTLAHIQVLSQRRGFLTNEARSAISLLFPFV